MDLLRHWRRRVFGAAASAVIVPVAVLLAALAVGVGGGGIGSLGALGQAFAGPELPEGGPPQGGVGGRDTADEAGRLLARVQRAETRASTPAQRRAAERRRRTNGAGPQRTGTTNPPDRPGAADPEPTPAPSAAPQPAPAPTPTPTPSTVRQVGDQVHEVTDPIPVVGPPAGEVVDLIVDTAEELPLP